MARTNSHTNYGSVAKGFHWMTALLVLTAFPLGFIAQELPYDTDAQLSLKASLFSAHKTVGVLAFFTAFFRIAWAITQPRPGLLNADKKLEAMAAETAHWLLYGSMLLVPLTGWIHHASTEGFAPIWLPFGQDLPLMPKSASLASLTATLHMMFVLVFGFTIMAHVGGALKHLIIDKDKTLQRMLPGFQSNTEVAPHPRRVTPLLYALVIWTVVMVSGILSGAFKDKEGLNTAVELAEVTSDWVVETGTLEIEITQFGAPVTGRFEDWTAQISFEEEPAEGKNGSVTVEVAIGSLSLGSVTQQAMGRDFFDVATFPTAAFTGDIVQNPDGDAQYTAEGVLALKGAELPLTLPFVLELTRDRATMTGAVSLERLDFGIGANLPDESNLGFGVDVSVSLTAIRN